MKKIMRSAIVAVALLAGFSAAGADFKNCRYSKSKGQDQFDNTRVGSHICNTRICAAVVLCDGDASASNVVCAMTPQGCPTADQCLKEHKANAIAFGAFTSTPYKEASPPTWPGDDGGGGAR